MAPLAGFAVALVTAVIAATTIITTWGAVDTLFWWYIAENLLHILESVSTPNFPKAPFETIIYYALIEVCVKDPFRSDTHLTNLISYRLSLYRSGFETAFNFDL